MAGFIDYRHIMEPSAMPEAAQSIDAAATVLLQKRTAEQQQKRQLELQREVEARKMAWQEGLTQQHEDRQKLADTRFRSQQELENTKARQSTDEKIRAAAANRDFARAQGISDNYAEVDPGTGEMRKGRGFKVQERDVGPEPVDPALLLERPTPTTDPARLKLETESALQDQATMQRHSREVSGWQSEKAKAKANPSVTIGETTTTPDELRYSAGRAAVQDFDAIGEQVVAQAASAGNSPMARRRLEMLGMLRPQVESGAIPVGEAARLLNKDLSDEEMRGFKEWAKEGDWKNQRAVAAMRGEMKPGTANSWENLGRRDEDQFRAQVSDLKKTYDVPNDVQAFYKYKDALSDASGKNRLLQGSAIFELAKEVSGGGGMSLSNKDVENLSPNAGVLAQIKDTAAKISSGQRVTAQSQKQLVDAIKARMGHVDARLGAARKAYQGFYDESLPYAARLGGGHLRATEAILFPGDAKLPQGVEEDPTVPSAPSARVRVDIKNSKRGRPVVPEAGFSKPASSGDALLDGLRKILGN